jgi:DNA-binding XRE family transcriptional regulator
MDYKQEYLKHRASRLPSKAQRSKFATIRKSNGITQQELAKDFSVHQTQISKFENGLSPDGDSEYLFYCYTQKFEI